MMSKKRYIRVIFLKEISAVKVLNNFKKAKYILLLLFLFCLSSCNDLSSSDPAQKSSCFSSEQSSSTIVTTEESFFSSSESDSEYIEDSEYNEDSKCYPFYYEDHLRSKVYTLKKIREQNSISYTFSFLTDLHWTSNTKNSPQLVKYLSSEIEINKIVLGGDYINYDYNEVDTPKSIMRECAASFSFGNYIAIVGNHDSNWNSGGDTPRISDKEVFSIMNNTDYDYPYMCELDNEKKLCSLYLNTGIGSFNDEDQKNFIYNILRELDNTWHVILFVHIIFDGSYHKDNLSVIRPAGEAFLGYFSLIKESLNCNFVGVFSGHSHLDYLNTKDYCFPVSTTMCDSIGTFTPDYNIYLREENTYTEQAFDIVQVDTNSRKVFLTRIGAGADRLFEY